MITLNLDYLEFATEINADYNAQLSILQETVETENFVFSQPRTSKEYQIIWDVWDKNLGAKIGIFLNRCCIFNQDKRCKFRFADYLFYLRGIDYETYKEMICLETGTNFIGLSRVDIALDTDEKLFLKGWQYDSITNRLKYNVKNNVIDTAEGLDGGELMQVIQHDKLQRERKYNNSRHDIFFEAVGRGNKTLTLYVGSRKGRTYSRIYDKTEEMGAKKEKEYITECWRNAGYDGEKPVFRYEIVMQRLTGDNKYRILDGFDFTKTLDWCDEKDMIKKLFSAINYSAFKFAPNRTGEYNVLLSGNEIYAAASLNVQLSDNTRPLCELSDAVIINNLTIFASKYFAKVANSREIAEYINETDVAILKSAASLFLFLHQRFDRRRRRWVATSNSNPPRMI